VRDTTRGERALVAGAWVALWLGFAWCVGLRSWGLWYSPSLAHRLQTEALLRGTFALQPTPYGQMADWAWGIGSQHVWGLGVGLVRLPFEAVARIVGAVGFPDRVTLVLAFVAVSLLCASAFAAAATTAWERVALALPIVAAPAFVILCRTRLAVYEESVAYAHLWAVAMASLLLRFATRRRDRDLVGACALAGLAPLFRPTLAFDAAVTVALAVTLRLASPRPREAWASLARAGAVFVAGLALVGFVGTRRFGSAFETGQLLNVSYIPTDQAAKLFGYPFRAEPFGRAAAELVSSLVLPAQWNFPSWYAAGIHPWQSPTVRFREIYFTPFTWWQLAVVLVAWLAVAAAFGAARRRPELRAVVAAPVGVAALWSAAVVACQFFFYLWAPSMTSRYAVDFAAPVGVGTSALLLMLLRATALAAPAMSATQLRVALAALVALWVGHDAASAAIAPSHAARPLFDAAQVAAALQRPPVDARPLPTTYRCGDAPESVGIKFNGSGWVSPGNCEVHAATMLFVPPTACVRVRVAAAAAATGGSLLRPEETAVVRAKLGLSEMRRTADEPTDDGRMLTFCAPADNRPNPRGIELLYLGWTTPETLSPTIRPFRLLEVSGVAAP
jgi:hypothetical protein